MAHTWSFFPDAATIIKAALRRVRAYDPEEATTISATQYANALETLNFIVSHWQAKGLQVWSRKQTIVTLVADQASYTTGSGGDISINRPLTIMQAWMRDTNDVDSPELEIIGPEEFNRIPEKTSAGTPIVLWYDAAYQSLDNYGSTSKGTIHLWPVPDSTVVASNSLVLFYQRPLLDFDATTDRIDMPQEWFEPLRLTLAYKIAPEYGMPVIEHDRLKGEMDEAIKVVDGWDSDMASITISPRKE